MSGDSIDRWADQIAKMRTANEDAKHAVEDAAAEAFAEGNSDRFLELLAVQQIVIEDLLSLCTRMAAELAATGSPAG